MAAMKKGQVEGEQSLKDTFIMFDFSQIIDKIIELIVLSYSRLFLQQTFFCIATVWGIRLVISQHAFPCCFLDSTGDIFK